MTTTVYHGTGTDYTGYPDLRTDVYGFHGVFLTESEGDAWMFAEGSTEGANDGMNRVFTGEVELDGVLDLTNADMDTDELVEAVENSGADVVILPDLSGVSEREILVRSRRAIEWTGILTD